MGSELDELEKRLDDMEKRFSLLLEHIAVLTITMTSILALTNKVNEKLEKSVDGWKSKATALEAQADLRYYVKMLEDAGLTASVFEKE